MILYFYYKNTALFMTQFWYSFQNEFSGEVIFESWTMSFYNVLFTVLPPFVIGIFDQYVSARLLDRYPQLYQLSQKGVFFQMHSFFSWVANGFYHSLILYFVSELIYFWDLPQGDGKIAGHWVWGTALYTAGLITTLGKAALITNIWTKYTVLAIPGSLVIWFIFLPIYATVAPKLGFSMEYYGVVPKLFGSPVFWLMIIVLPVLCLLRDFAWKYAKRMYYPQAYHHVQEIQKYNIQDYRPRYAINILAIVDLFSNVFAEWSSFKRQSGKCGKCSVCENSVAMRSRKQTSHRPECCRRTILLGKEEDMERWRVVGISTTLYMIRMEYERRFCTCVCNISIFWHRSVFKSNRSRISIPDC